MNCTIYRAPNNRTYLNWAACFHTKEYMSGMSLRNLRAWLDYMLDTHPDWEYYCKCKQCHQKMLGTEVGDFTYEIIPQNPITLKSATIFKCDACNIITPDYETKLDIILDSYPRTIKSHFVYEKEHLDNIEKLVTNTDFETNINIKFYKFEWSRIR